MSRKPDKHSAGRSRRVPFRPGETPQERHARRLLENAKRAEMVGAFCGRNDIVLRIRNDGHHWKFSRGERICEWWPSSAKFVVDRKYDDGVHVHDWEQCIRLLRSVFGSRGA